MSGNGALARGRFGQLGPAPAQEVDGAQIERLFLFRAEPDSAPLVIGGDAAGAVLVWDYPYVKCLQARADLR